VDIADSSSASAAAALDCDDGSGALTVAVRVSGKVGWAAGVRAELRVVRFDMVSDCCCERI
jgi:hypothetical protein